MTKEKYYAIRIGDPRRHSPYFMLDEKVNRMVPALFATRKEALRHLNNSIPPSARVLKVHLHDGICESINSPATKTRRQPQK